MAFIATFASAEKSIRFDAFRNGFVEKHCFECHDSEMAEGELDLEALAFDLDNPRSFERWVRIHDRVKSGEMPPKDKLSPELVTSFTKAVGEVLAKVDRERAKRDGRAVLRRLNRHEYESTLRDLLKTPWIDVADILPEDGRLHGFNRSGESLDVSHVHMARYLKAADRALRRAMIPQVNRPDTISERFYASEQAGFIKHFNRGGPPMRHPFPVFGTGPDKRFPKMYEILNWTQGGAERKTGYKKRSREFIDEEGVGVVVSTYEPTLIRFDSFNAPITGRYRLRIKTHSIWVGTEMRWIEPNPRLEKRALRAIPRFHEIEPGKQSEPVTVYAAVLPSSFRKLKSINAYPEPSVDEMEVTLIEGETILPDAARLFRYRGSWAINPLASAAGMPGVSFRWLEVEGPIIDEWPTAGHRVLFGNLPVVEGENGEVLVVSKSPFKDAKRLLRSFMDRAYRGPYDEEDFETFLTMATDALKHGEAFHEAMFFAYRGVLCSPRFIYIEQEPGKLDAWGLASRLSYFLWNSAPDPILRELAANGTITQSSVLREQVERLLRHPNSERFRNAFLDYWLDLKNIADTAPDGSLYPDYQLDDLLVESMVEESQTFFKELVERDLSAVNIIDSDFVMINERLADHYEIENVKGVDVRPVLLPSESMRGGVMTQASVLKVTANGNNTSPILRGIWVMERLLGEHVPPPPENVPAVEPDTRGAVTIRELLEKHKNDKTCASCHRKIDPYGFALEGFDVMGGTQEYYRAIGGVPLKGGGHNGRPFEFHYGLKSETHGKLLGGGDFKDVRDLKYLLAKNPRKIAKGLLSHLVTYSTGSPVRFSDREVVDRILDRVERSEYGVRTLIHEIVQSRLFLEK